MAVERSFECRSVEATLELARALGARLESGTLLALDGELGAGKTTFLRGLAAGLEVVDPVSSPTYTLMHEYRGRLPLYHFDAWMEGREREFLADGGFELLGRAGVSAVEWAERVADCLPRPHLAVRLEYVTPEARRVVLRVVGASPVLEALLDALEAPPEAVAEDREPA